MRQKKKQWYTNPRPKTPAQKVAVLFGSFSAVARACGVTTTTAGRWVNGNAQTGTPGGVIPARYHACLLEAAKKQGLALTLLDLMYNAKDTKPKKPSKPSRGRPKKEVPKKRGRPKKA